MSQIQAWQLLAGTFRVTDHLVKWGKLPPNYEPTDAVFLYENTALSTHERSIVGFLLHVWNHYDYPFELSEVAGWDSGHQKAFTRWVDGRTLSRPFRYF